MTDFIRRFTSEDHSVSNERSENKKRRREQGDESGKLLKPRVMFMNPPLVKTNKRRAEDIADDVEQRIKRDRRVPPPPPIPAKNPATAKRIGVAENDENAKNNVPSSASTLSMYNYTLNLLKQDVKEKSDKVRRSRIMERWEYNRLAATSEIECEGDMRCRLMDEALAYIEKKGLEYSPAQKVILKALRVCSYAQFYGDTIQFHLPRLLGACGCSEIRSELLAFLARRQGKSTIVSVNCACELVTQPFGHDICVYANNGRASRLVMMLVYKFVRILSAPDSGFGGRINNLNKNEGMSYMTRWGTINKLTAFPAKEENLRGTGSTENTGTVIIDEINYCAPSMVSKIIAPTLIRKRVKFVGITTISGYDSFVTPLADARYPDGRKVMLTLNFEMVCEDCKARGEPEKCKCLMADLPHWHLSTQLEKLEILMAADPDTYLREMKNVATDSSITPAFDPRDVAHLRKPDCVMRMTEIISPTIFVSVDPACGGDMSKMAIVSAIYVDSMMIIIGIEAFTASGMHAPSLHGDLVTNHIKAVRNLPGLSGAKVIFVPESNTGFESQHYCKGIIDNEIPHVYLMDEDKKHVGMRTDNKAKKQMAILFNHALRARVVRFHPLLVTTDANETSSNMKKVLIDQVSNFKRKIKVRKVSGEDDGELRYTEIYSGKFGGRKDDQAMGAMINYLGYVIYLQKYEEVYRTKKPLWSAT